MGKPRIRAKGLKMTAGTVAIIVIICLLVGSGIVLLLNAIAPAPIGGSGYNEGRAYTIYKYGTTYYADAERVGFTSFSGTNASDVIQDALDAVDADGGGVIQFAAGLYMIDTPLEVGDDTHIYGEGNSTVFTPDGPIDCIFTTQADGNTGVELYDFTIRTESETDILDYGIFIESTVYCIVDGIYVISGDVYESINVSIQVMGVGVSVRDCGIINPGHTGILVGLGSGVEVSRCAIDGCNGFEANGILMVMTVGSFIRDNYVVQMEQAGIALSWCWLDQVLNNYVYNCGSPGENDTGNFDFSGITDCTIVGNVAAESEWDGCNCVDVANSTFSANIWSENGMDGLWFDSDCEGNVVQGDQAFDNTNGYDFRSVGESNLFIGCACGTITVDTHDQIAYCIVDGTIVTNP